MSESNEFDSDEEIISEIIIPIKLPGTFPSEELTNEEKLKIERWKNIHQSFQDLSLIRSWEDRDFSLEEAWEWFNIGFTPDEAQFVQWIRDIKLKNYQAKKHNNQSKTEFVLNELNKNILHKEFEQNNAK